MSSEKFITSLSQAEREDGQLQAVVQQGGVTKGQVGQPSASKILVCHLQVRHGASGVLGEVSVT